MIYIEWYSKEIVIFLTIQLLKKKWYQSLEWTYSNIVRQLRERYNGPYIILMIIIQDFLSSILYLNDFIFLFHWLSKFLDLRPSVKSWRDKPDRKISANLSFVGVFDLHHRGRPRFQSVQTNKGWYFINPMDPNSKESTLRLDDKRRRWTRGRTRVPYIPRSPRSVCP